MPVRNIFAVKHIQKKNNNEGDYHIEMTYDVEFYYRGGKDADFAAV